MKKVRGSEARVKVDIPVSFTYEDIDQNRRISSKGRIDHMSINDMCLELPLSAEIIEKHHIDFDLDLPNPFVKIKAHGKIQWKRWDAEKRCTTCGVQLEPMTLSQLSDLDMLIRDICEENKK